MTRYQIRSRALLDIYNDIKHGRLETAPYYQRNLVWRDKHKKDFIKTILDGLPFPLIFIAQGDLDLEKMQSVSSIVDGQQRTTTIYSFVQNEFPVDGKYYRDLSGDEQSAFLKYEVPVVELDLDHKDPTIKEIFQRLNKTADSLTAIEIQATEYGPSEFMLVARMILNELTFPADDEDEKDWRVDPNVPEEFYDWAKKTEHQNIRKLFLNSEIFTPIEIAKKVPLQYLLDVMATTLFGYFHRHDQAKKCLEHYEEDFPEKDTTAALLEESAKLFLSLKFTKKSGWKKKANFFTLLSEISFALSNKQEIDTKKLKEKLLNFSEQFPEDYAAAAKNSVNDRRQRELRGEYIKKLLAM